MLLTVRRHALTELLVDERVKDERLAEPLEEEPDALRPHRAHEHLLLKDLQTTRAVHGANVITRSGVPTT